MTLRVAAVLDRFLQGGFHEAWARSVVESGRRADAGLLIYRQSLERFIKIGEEAGADGYIANHPYRDQTFIDGRDDKIAKNRARKAGDPSPWIGRSTYIRYMLISLECTEALTGWVQAGRPPVGQ